MVSKWLPSFLSNCNYQNLSSLSPQSSQPRFWRAFHKQLTFNIQVLLPSQPLVVIVVQSLSHVWLFANPWTAAHLAFLSFTISWSLLKLMSIELVMPSNHLILCCPLFLLPSNLPASGSFLMSRLSASGAFLSMGNTGEGNSNQWNRSSSTSSQCRGPLFSMEVSMGPRKEHTVKWEPKEINLH